MWRYVESIEIAFLNERFLTISLNSEAMQANRTLQISKAELNLQNIQIN